MFFIGSLSIPKEKITLEQKSTSAHIKMSNQARKFMGRSKNPSFVIPAQVGTQ